MWGFYCIAFIESSKKNFVKLNLLIFSEWLEKKWQDRHFQDKYDKSWLWTKKIDETRNYLLEEIKHNDFISEKHKKLQGFELLWTFCFNFCCQWLRLNFCICFISWCSCWYGKFCSRIKNLCNHSRN